MQRRKMLCFTLAGFLALALPGLGRTQTTKAPITIGFLHAGTEAAYGHLLPHLKAELARLGWRDGAQVVYEERWASGKVGALPLMARDLAARQPALIVASPNSAVIAARQAAPLTPIIMSAAADPVGTGLAKSLARPGGQVTGLASMVAELSNKYLDYLLEAAPKVRHVVFLVDATKGRGRPSAKYVENAQRSAQERPIQADFSEYSAKDQIEPRIRAAQKRGAHALIVLPGPGSMVNRREIIRVAQALRWPAIGWAPEFSDDGLLLAYGPDFTGIYRRAAYYADRILRGAKPSDLPIEQPTRFELVVNKKAAGVIGITIAQSLLVRADRVIE